MPTIQLNELGSDYVRRAELDHALSVNRSKPIVIGLPPRVVLDKPLNIKHDADITLRSDNTEIVGEQIYIKTPGVLTYQGLAHCGFSEKTGRDLANYWLGHAELSTINGRLLCGEAREMRFENCTMLWGMDDLYGGSANIVRVRNCLIGLNRGTGQCGLVTQSGLLELTDSVFVGCMYRQPVKADKVTKVVMRRNVIVGAHYHMEASGVERWEVCDNWFWPERMGLHRPICPQGGGEAVCVGNYLWGRIAPFGEVFGNLRGYNDKQNAPQVANMTGAYAYPFGPAQDDFRRIIDSAGSPVVNELTILARRMAIELGGLKAA